MLVMVCFHDVKGHFPSGGSVIFAINIPGTSHANQSPRCSLYKLVGQDVPILHTRGVRRAENVPV